MTSKICCLAIGVSDAPPLTYLQGAVNGAHFFGKWAQEQGHTTKILTDEEEPVGIREIRNALLELISGNQRIERLFLYFAGHGLARDISDDLWLTSDWFDEQRAVSVRRLRYRLESFGIDQLTVISDACRLLPSGPEAAELQGDQVLGRGRFDRSIVRSDIFRAASTYKAAYMIPGENLDDDRCIFSGVLEEALLGAHKGAFEPIRMCITSGSLTTFLEKEVPRRASQYGVELLPDISPGLIPPHDVYLSAAPTNPPALRSWPHSTQIEALNAKSGCERRTIRRGWSTKAHAEPPDAYYADTEIVRPRINVSKSSNLSGDDIENRTIDILIKNRSNTTKLKPQPIGTSFIVIGDFPKKIFANEHVKLAKANFDPWRVLKSTSKISMLNPKKDRARLVFSPLLIKLASNRWIGAAALPSYAGRFTVNNMGVSSLIYSRSDDDAVEVEGVMAMLQSGELAIRRVRDLAVEMRQTKVHDPMRGVIAAYLYDSIGDIDNIRRTAHFLALRGIPIPFDIALLGQLSVAEEVDGTYLVDIPSVKGGTGKSDREKHVSWASCALEDSKGVVAGSFPWLRQGWTLLDQEKSALVADGLSEIARYLYPSPFTTLSEEGGRQLKQLFSLRRL